MTFNGAGGMKKALHPPLPDDVFCQPESVIPSFIEAGKDIIRRITVSTVSLSNKLVDILQGKYSEKFDEFHMIDCRYPYEYQGGHIKNAENITTVEAIENKFFKSPSTKKTVIIFHCEYSAQRAPQMYF